MSYSTIQDLLGSEAESLLNHECKTIDKGLIHLPGSDFLDRVFIDTNRSNQVLNSLALGCTTTVVWVDLDTLSILPVDQGIEHSAAASFAPNPRFTSTPTILLSWPWKPVVTEWPPPLVFWLQCSQVNMPTRFHSCGKD